MRDVGIQLRKCKKLGENYLSMKADIKNLKLFL